MPLELPYDHPYRDGRICSHCREFKLAFDYAIEKDNKAYKGVAMRSTCKPCTEFRKYKAFIKKAYGITYEQYQELLEKQNYCCAICSSPTAQSARTTDKMFIDHCHKTGEVRGLLCSKCNHGLGFFDDRIDLLSKAILYLAKDKEI